MNKLYVLQYDDDPYCAPYSGEIFTDKNEVLEFLKNYDPCDMRYISVYDCNKNNNRTVYRESYHFYYLDKSHYSESVRYFWDDFEDKTFISSEDFHNILSKM